jgi:hypothetical protein
VEKREFFIVTHPEHRPQIVTKSEALLAAYDLAALRLSS